MVEKKLLKTSEVIEILDISRTKLWQMECEELIPGAVRLGKSVRWNQVDIYLWIKLGCPSAKQFKVLRIGENLSKVYPDKLIGQDEVMEITGLGRTKLWNMRSGGQLPIPISLGQSVRWKLSDIYLWIKLGCPSTQQFNKLKLSEDLSKICSDRLIDEDEVMKITESSRNMLSNMQSGGQLPVPLSLGKSVRWKLSDIEDWFGLDGQSLDKSG